MNQLLVLFIVFGLYSLMMEIDVSEQQQQQKKSLSLKKEFTNQSTV